MNRNETLKIMAVIKAAYPYYYSNQSEEDLKTVVSLWQGMLEDYEYPLVSGAVRAFIASDRKGFPPSVGMVLDKLRLFTTAPELSEMEAWQRLSGAVKNSAWYAKEEFEKLPEDIRGIVGSPASLREWALMDAGTFHSVIQSNFMRSYRACRGRQRALEELPENVRHLVGELAEHKDLLPADGSSGHGQGD
ncbi:replicative helicase loader/inhibitor [Eubacterium sp. 1001713B170207_170306_E7]|uniref:replicative helicase loader/inhibitor n=1 Tax=Eubacterium sp. 1001713B170207_170306_E7 TaxID=2787097 RepID=UPI00189C0C42